ncbi:GntR family transcriptional regulator [Roseibium denhamense]|uniref:DNA-binding transcriptional regulator, GntR family n=1 Tax=Roseibium denhamense TaxID=76305 RepID=A0ABY1N5A8_9HYPH|nr:GntR family transcriptional regulator [Roseibium denhamense]MTI04650.1 GntR family transcriptional regulator [Roseibium denhamense]SMP00403.1 DNA-binding transcriptional regulator, GntR family [Roseibium denhamense]
MESLLAHSPTPDKKTIFETLRRRICLLDYQPGDSLNERLLAEEFSVSRTPMRAVLQRLEYDGLISSQHGRGTIVTSIDLNQMREIYTLRIKLAETIADTPARQIAVGLHEELISLATDTAALFGGQDKRAFGAVSIRLHDAIQLLTTNEILRDFSDTLFYQSARYWFLLLPRLDWDTEVQDMLDEVRLTTRCLEAGDIPAAVTTRKVHLSLVMARIAKIEDFPDLQLEDL